MLDQSFSSHNFEKIFLAENRKGNINKSFLPEEYYVAHERFKATVAKKELLRKKNGELTPEEIEDFAQKLDEINKTKALIRINTFNKLSEWIQLNNFSFNLEYVPIHEAYRTGNNTAESFFSLKQLQRNINKTFKVKQASRNQIIRQVFGLLKDGYPKIVIRTDINSFYESIPQNRLISKLEKNRLLSNESVKMIKKLLYEFEEVKDTAVIDINKGVPRGIGVSAYLAELYMREVDEKIRQMDDVVYYARFVDDIIAVFVPKSVSSIPDYKKEIKSIVEEEDLLLNDGEAGTSLKTHVLPLHSGVVGNFTKNLTFLGYKFIVSRTEVLKDGRRNFVTDLNIEISNNKVDRYIRRLELTIDDYNQGSKYNEKLARNLLFDRLKFLTGNYHLSHSKRTIKAGIFYSNSELILDRRKRYDSLGKLEMNLVRLIKSKLAPYPKLGIDKVKLGNYILSRFSFKDGFFNKEDHFHTFRLKPKEQSYYFNKNQTTSKFELIKSIWHHV